MTGSLVVRLRALLLTLLLAGCGSTPLVREATTSPPLTTGSVQVKQTGNASVTIPSGSVSLDLDAAGLLVMHARVHSGAAATQSISLRASLYDAGGNLIGDAEGGRVAVAPGADTDVQLNGPAPNGTVSSVTLEAVTTAEPSQG